MPMCGFNQKMFQGLREFGEGLWDAAVERATADGLSLRESFDQEIAEITLFVDLLSRRSQPPQALIGIANLTQALYRNGRGLEEPKDHFFQGMEKMIQEFAALDHQYYQNLLPRASSRWQAMEQLVAGMK